MKILRTLLAATLVFVLITSCAGIRPAQKIIPGETVFLDYTCRTKGGEIVFTTNPDIAKDTALKKSRVFAYPNSYAAGPITAGMDRTGAADEGLRPLELELYYRLSRAVVGLEKEKEHEVALESEVPEGLDNQVRFQVRPRIVTIPRIKTIPRYEYDRVFEKAPEIGMILKNSKKELGKVVSFDDRSVNYEMTVVPGYEFESTLGTARMTVTGEGKTVTTEIEARPGTLVRQNRAIGKIVEVTDRDIKIDFGHPFAGETLQCTVKALSRNPYPETENQDTPGNKMNSDE